jgi:hypothetical protein
MWFLFYIAIANLSFSPIVIKTKKKINYSFLNAVLPITNKISRADFFV